MYNIPFMNRVVSVFASIENNCFIEEFRMSVCMHSICPGIALETCLAVCCLGGLCKAMVNKLLRATWR